MNDSVSIKESIRQLPSDPGVYKYYNQKDTLIYVGKAKNLKKRVSSYFNKQTGLSLKTRKLVQDIHRIEFVVVNSEFDALLLENNLIKENQPRFNILLKDDKTFPYVCISKDRFPKVYSTRRLDKTEGEHFGPYTNVKALNSVLELIQKLYKIRTCNYSLTEENIQSGKFKVCLEYHIANCLGPCEGLQSEADYMDEISQVRHILKGNLKSVKDVFAEEMNLAAQALKFEDALIYKNKIDLLDKFQNKTVIVSTSLRNIDIITLTSADQKAYLNYMRVDQGMINISHSIEIKKKLDEPEAEILQLVCIQMREQFESKSRVILSNIAFESWTEEIEIVVPKIGDKKTLVNLSYKNALAQKKNAINKAEAALDKGNRVVKQLQTDLKLKELPNHIECFDNSNIQGTNPVASMVCFKKGKPSKKDYRHFKIKTIVGPDDFGSMNEIVTRRYKRLQEEKLPYPQLIIVDGGKGQLSAACEALKSLGLYHQIPIIGIAKRLEEIYYPEDSIPVHISKKSESLKLIQQLRDEAHRFAITFHRDLRSKGQTESELDSIRGIGKKTRTILLQEYKSFKKISKASEEELAGLIGPAKAKVVLAYIHNNM
ncbi:excinuclease ABC subunit C [Reichenbachiella sp. 5M10]|uniref:excinuclease ABC subunit UvrC n=1 Tax=Reichenbachiella sp. 5M10 TaxID=1889772 RepID=UPI000C15FA77|nr:excinuclease ABC subunit UvrC [Reichenbachiella sp. 5M10]PIB37295.1 excinuclease ABC subunit C [Reichenbachiella sp. 5M10]